MASALIGHTGFVGGNLARQRGFDEYYHSANIEAIAGRAFDLIVCAGAPAAKWKANQDPDGDRRCLDRLWASLGRARAARLVLISTVDVYARPVQVDEDSDVDAEHATPYGRHRHALERHVAETFDALIVRLPGLFGAGLKKNIIHDFLHGHELHKIDRRATYQFYGLANLWADIEVALRAGLRLVNIATEPVSVAAVAREAFGLDFTNELASAPAFYDFRSKHGQLFGGPRGYLYDRGRILRELKSFVAASREERRCA
jgi:nucleoside-diphosphate-sugar epimerase